MKAKASGLPTSTKAEPRGLTKRALARMTRIWRTAVREIIMRMQYPSHASLRDMIVVLDAILTEIKMARRVTAVLARPARKAVA